IRYLAAGITIAGPVRAPLPHVAVDVVQTPRVRFLLSHRMGPMSTMIQIPGVLLQLSISWIVTIRKPARTSRPARVFPLGLGRQSVFVTWRQFPSGPFQMRQLTAELVCFIPSDPFNRQTQIAFAVGRIVRHQFQPLPLGHFVLPEPEPAANSHGRLWSFVFYPIRLVCRTAHGKATRWNPYELNAEVVC